MKKSSVTNFSSPIMLFVAAAGMSYQGVCSKLISFSPPQRTIAQWEGSGEIAIRNYYLKNVNPSSSAQMVSFSSDPFMNSMLIDHMNSQQRSGAFALMAWIGASDSGYDNTEKWIAHEKERILEVARQMKKDHGGGTIYVKAGNTNTGIGQLVLAVQDAEFIAKVLAEANVRIVTAGQSAGHAAMKHGSGPGKYGNNFMNTNLTATALIPTPPDVWSLKETPGVMKGVSAEVHVSTNMVQKGAEKNIATYSYLTISGGGPIGTEEGTQAIEELRRMSAELKQPANKILNITIQTGLDSGVTPGEIRAFKGPNGADDMILSMAKAAATNNEPFRNLGALGITIQNFGESGNRLSSELLTEKTLLSTAQKLQSTPEGRRRVVRAQVYTTDIRLVERYFQGTQLAQSELARLAEIQKQTKDQFLNVTFADDSEKAKAKTSALNAVDRLLGIRSGDEIRALGNEMNKLREAAKTASNDSEKSLLEQELKEKQRQLGAIREALRIRGYSNSVIAYTQALVDLSVAYSGQLKSSTISEERRRSLIEMEKRMTKLAERLAGSHPIEIKGGRVVRSNMTAAQKAGLKAR